MRPDSESAVISCVPRAPHLAALVLATVSAVGGLALAQTHPGNPPLQQPRSEVSFSARVKAGEEYSRRFGPDFVFVLQPDATADGSSVGWIINVHRTSGVANLADLTIPLRFSGRQIDLFAWHFLPDANAPRENRIFVFAPDVGMTITESAILGGPDNRALDLLYSWGRGELQVRKYALSPNSMGFSAAFEWIDFSVRLSWPKNYDPRTFKARPVR